MVIVLRFPLELVLSQSPGPSLGFLFLADYARILAPIKNLFGYKQHFAYT